VVLEAAMVAGAVVVPAAKEEGWGALLEQEEWADRMLVS